MEYLQGPRLQGVCMKDPRISALTQDSLCILKAVLNNKKYQEGKYPILLPSKEGMKIILLLNKT